MIYKGTALHNQNKWKYRLTTLRQIAEFALMVAATGIIVSGLYILLVLTFSL